MGLVCRRQRNGRCEGVVIQGYTRAFLFWGDCGEWEIQRWFKETHGGLHSGLCEFFPVRIALVSSALIFSRAYSSRGLVWHMGLYFPMRL